MKEQSGNPRRLWQGFFLGGGQGLDEQPPKNDRAEDLGREGARTAAGRERKKNPLLYILLGCRQAILLGRGGTLGSHLSRLGSHLVVGSHLRAVNSELRFL